MAKVDEEGKIIANKNIEFIIKKSIKEYCNQKGYKISKDLNEALNEIIQKKLDETIERMIRNGRLVVSKKDI